MQLRTRLAAYALDLARWLGSSAKAPGPGGGVDLTLDLENSAEAPDLPSTPWLGLGERLRTRSLKTLRLEALYAVAALHQAHELAVAVFRQRVAEELDPAQRGELLARTDEWTRDAALLGQALGMLGALRVPDALLAAYFEVTPEELEALEELAEQGEAHLHRALLAEQAAP